MPPALYKEKIYKINGNGGKKITSTISIVTGETPPLTYIPITMAAVAESSKEDNKLVIVRVKRKAYQSRLDAFCEFSRVFHC